MQCNTHTSNMDSSRQSRTDFKFKQDLFRIKNSDNKGYNMKFKYGTVTSVDLLQQQNNYINYLTDFVRSKYSFILERKILDVYMDYPIKYEAVRINK